MDRDRALERWRSDLESWAIPAHIERAAPESPWVLPVKVFDRRVDEREHERPDPSTRRALDALDPPGTVLDVGAGAGAASLVLAVSGAATELVAVDEQSDMLEAMAERAARRGVALRTFVGRWPDLADDVPVADVVVCHHVLYNVADLGPFALALTRHARRRVVVELTRRHPLSGLNPLWRRLHGVERPEQPTADQAAVALRTLGLDVSEERSERAPTASYDSFADLVAVTRRRLCLPAERDEELSEALLALGVDPAQPADPLGSREMVTLWWPGCAG